LIQAFLPVDHGSEQRLSVGCLELRLQAGVGKVAVVLIAAVDEDGDRCLGDVLLLHFGHLPAVLADCIDQRPDDVDAVLIRGYFGPQLGVEVEEDNVLVVLVEQEVLHHQESYNDVRLCPLQQHGIN
jgi:hypothetical protein